MTTNTNNRETLHAAAKACRESKVALDAALLDEKTHETAHSTAQADLKTALSTMSDAIDLASPAFQKVHELTNVIFVYETVHQKMMNERNRLGDELAELASTADPAADGWAERIEDASKKFGMQQLALSQWQKDGRADAYKNAQKALPSAEARLGSLQERSFEAQRRYDEICANAKSAEKAFREAQNKRADCDTAHHDNLRALRRAAQVFTHPGM